jgi:integrase
MANLYLRGTTYWMQYRLNGRRYQETTGTHDAAKAKIALQKKLGDVASLRHAKRMGLPVPEVGTDARMSLEKFLEKYEEHYLNAGGPALRPSRERSWKADLAALRSVVAFLERQGVHQVAKVERRHVEAFRDWRLSTPVKVKRRVPVGKRTKLVEVEKDLSGATVNKAIRVGRAAWSWAIRSGFAREPHPFKGVKAVKLPRYEPEVLNELELRKVLDAAGGLLPIIATAAYAGLRNSELCALEWPDVDFRRGQVRILCDETFNTKSRKPRLVPLADELRGILEPSARKVGLCFPSPATGEEDRERPWTPQGLCAAVRRVEKRAGVAFSLQTLRRTFGSLLVAKGVPPTRVRDYLGHASLATTEGYYLERGGEGSADDVNLIHLGIAAVAGAAQAG